MKQMKKIRGMTPEIAYVLGVLDGDGCITDQQRCIRLKVKDLDFAVTFKRALEKISGYPIKIRKNEGYYVSELHMREAVNYIKSLNSKIPQNLIGYYLRGFFDSEGNANCSQHPSGQNSYARRVSCYNTNLSQIRSVKTLLRKLGISTRKISTMSRKTSKGNKPLYELCLNSGKENYQLFLDKVGFSIYRKQVVLKKMISAYIPNANAENLIVARRVNSLKCMEKRNGFLDEAIKHIKKLPKEIKATQRNCIKNIPNYNVLLKHYKHSQIMEMMINSSSKH